MPTPTRRYSGLAGFDIGTTDVIPGFDVKTPDVAAPSTPPPERSLIDNHELITDLARYAENLCSESAIRKKWKLDEATWELLGDSDELIRAVEEEQVRRVRSGQLKREKAQAHIVRGVDVLATVMDNPRANDRHRIDSIRALDQLADPGPQAGVEQERIYIKIDLGSDVRAKGQASDPKDILELEVQPKPKPPPIDSWDERKQLKQENAPPRRKDGDRDNDF